MPSSSSSLHPTSPSHSKTNNDNDMASGTVAAQQAMLRGAKRGTDDSTTSTTASDLAVKGTRRRVDEAKQTSDQRRKQKMNQSRLNDDDDDDDDDDEQAPRPTTTVFVASSISTNLEDFFPAPLSPASTSAASIATAFGEDEETSDQRIARKLEAIAKKTIIQQSDSANFDNIISELKNSCSASANQQQQEEDSAPSAPSFLKIKLPSFSDQYRSPTSPTVVLYDKYPLGDLLRYWFLYNALYHHLGMDVSGINGFFRVISKRKICSLFDDTTAKYLDNRFTHSQMQRIAEQVYPKVTIRDLAASKSSEPVPLRAFTLFGTFKNILTTDHSARIAQQNHVVPCGGLTEGYDLIGTYRDHWGYDDLCKHVFIVNGTAGSGKTIAALRMAHNRPREGRSPPKDIVIYINVDDVYAQGKPWKEFGKARLEQLYRNPCSPYTEYADFLEKALVETFDRLLPPSQFKQDFNTEYRVVIVLDDMDRNFALRLHSHAKTKIVRKLQEKFFGPLPKESTGESDKYRVFRVNFIVNAPTTHAPCTWPFDPFSTAVGFEPGPELLFPFSRFSTNNFIENSVFDLCCTFKEQLKKANKTNKNCPENLKLVNALCSNARCAALLFFALNERLLEEKQRTDSVLSISMRSLDELAKTSFPKVIREYTKRCGLSKFQHPEKALLVALAISIFYVPLLPRTLQHCPLLRKSLKLVDENDDDDDDDDDGTNKSFHDLLVEETGLLIESPNPDDAFDFRFTTSPAHVGMIHIIFGIPFSTHNSCGNKLTYEKCFLISLVAPYFAEIKRALFIEQFNVDVGLGQSVKKCGDAVMNKEKEPNDWQRRLTRWSYHTGESYHVEEYGFKEALVFGSIQGKSSDVFFFRNNLCMATEDSDDEEFEQRFRSLDEELTKKSSCSLQRNSFPIFILSIAEDDTFPQVAVVGPGKVVLAHNHQRWGTTITKAVNVNADDVNLDDDKSLNSLLASCLDKGSSSNDKDESKKHTRPTDAQIRYLKALQRIAKNLVS